MKNPGEFAASLAEFKRVKVARLKPHPLHEQFGLAPDAQTLSKLAARGAVCFHTPITVDQQFRVLDGLEVLHLACLRGRDELVCVQLELTPHEAICRMLDAYQGTRSLRPFLRVLIALELEPDLKADALANQQHGGRFKGSSRLTEASCVDVRAFIARAAGVSVGNVSKVKKILAEADPEIMTAVRNGEISINCAAEWSELELVEQRRAYKQHLYERGINRTIKTLISRHTSSSNPTPTGYKVLCDALENMRADPHALSSCDSIDRLLKELGAERSGAVDDTR